MVYIIDKLHSKGHVDAWCKSNCFPDNDCNEELMRGVNTSACEQFNSIAARYKFMVRLMGRLSASFQLDEVAEVRNDEWLASRSA